MALIPTTQTGTCNDGTIDCHIGRLVSGDSYFTAASISWSINGDNVTWTMNIPLYQRIKLSSGLYKACNTKGIGTVRFSHNGSAQTPSWLNDSPSPKGYYSDGDGNFSNKHNNVVYVNTINNSYTTTLSTTEQTFQIYFTNGAGTKLSNYSSIDISFTLAWPVTYNANGGTGTTAPQTKKANQALTLSNCNFTREGYRFTGWNDRADGTGNTYTAGSTYGEAENEALILYAQWESISIPVWINTGDGLKQVKDAYYNDNGTIKKCDVWLNADGQIKRIK